MSTAVNISNTLGKSTPDMTIAWEATPSLQHLVRRTEPAHADVPSWAETMPAELYALDEPVVFREALEGLAVRDLDEPEIFRVFFGEADGARAAS